MSKYRILAYLCLTAWISIAHASTLVVPMYHTQTHHLMGTIKISESLLGLQFKVHMSGVSPGEHGFHLHAHASCRHHGLGAGGHYDPMHTNRHLGPYREGHLGDLPVIIANKQGIVDMTVLVPRIKQLSLVKGRAIIVHVFGDNYSDNPKPLGGGGPRLACGIIKE